VSESDAAAPFDVGYWLSSEEHGARALIDDAVRAEASGFRSAMISDHFHPWTPTQGHAPFVWTVIGGIAARTSTLHVATGVTAPIIRMHPVIVAHAAATAAVVLAGRFALGLGTGERLNEHVTGQPWPRPGVRRRMLAEAIDVVRALLAGGQVDHDGLFFRVEHTELFSRPPASPPIWVAVAGRRSARLAAERADGMIAVQPDPRLVDAFEAAGGRGRPRVAQLHVCWAADEADARATAHRWWPIGALPPRLLSELERPADVAAAAALVTEESVAGEVVCGPDPQRHIEAIARFAAAGYTRVYVHQVGPDQHGFMAFYEREVLPAFAGSAGR
jgi:G6PDH family F420-dependent oxidoreductase